jgi:hypothetical protein
MQGEVLELDLESALRRCFLHDEIIPVAKGTHGGDLLHRVRDEFGHDCGSLIWESKRTKTWSDGWLGKLKDDKIAAKAQLAVLVSVTLPKDIASFECRANVWVTPPHLSLPLAAALRLTLIETAAIFECFMGMRADLEGEKKAIQRIWSKREKQIERVMANAVGLHGDLAGIIGNSLPQIEQMELASLPNRSDCSTK